MIANFLIYSLGIAPMYATRAFLPAFLTLLYVKLPGLFIEDVSLFSVPLFSSQQAAMSGGVGSGLLFLFFLLAILELYIEKKPEFRDMYSGVDTYVKMAAFGFAEHKLTQSGIPIEFSAYADGGDGMMNFYSSSMAGSGSFVNYLIMALGTGIIFVVTQFRNMILSVFIDMDEDDDLMIRKSISWLEDGGVLFAFWLLLFLGIVAVILFLIGAYLLYQFKKNHEKRLEQQKIACVDCGALNLPFAPLCYNCGSAKNNTYDIGILGQKKKTLVSDKQLHNFRLQSQRRCTLCAAKLPYYTTKQTCQKCNTNAFGYPSVEDYISHTDSKLWKVLLASFLLGFIPVGGIIATVALVNFKLVAPYRRYLPKGRRLLLRWIIRIVTIIIVFFGSFSGFILGPIYVLIRHQIAKWAFNNYAVNRVVYRSKSSISSSSFSFSMIFSTSDLNHSSLIQN